MEARVRVAVLGVGSLGRQHTRIYGEMHRRGTVELVGVYDTDSALAKSIAEKHGTAALGSVEAAAAAAELRGRSGGGRRRRRGEEEEAAAAAATERRARACII